MMNNNKEIPEAVLNFVKKNGFDNAEYLGKWKTFRVYNPTYDSETVMGGPTPFILYKFGLPLWTTRAQTDKLFDIFFP